MTSKTKVKQLQKQYDRITHADTRPQIVRHVTQDGRLLNKDGYLLSEKEKRKVKKEDIEISNNGGMIILLTSYAEPRTGLTSSN